MDGVHSREEVLKAADDALAQVRGRSMMRANVWDARAETVCTRLPTSTFAAQAHALRKKRQEGGKALEVELVYPEGLDGEGVQKGWMRFVEVWSSVHTQAQREEDRQDKYNDGSILSPPFFLHHFHQASEGHHATMKTRSLFLLPVTSAFSLLPIPNVFFL